MTQEELDAEKLEGRKLMKDIQTLLDGKEETVVLNTLLCVLINACVDLQVEPVAIITALADGFSLITVKLSPEAKLRAKENLN